MAYISGHLRSRERMRCVRISRNDDRCNWPGRDGRG